MSTLVHISRSPANLIALLVVIAYAAPSAAAAEPTNWTTDNKHLSENGAMSVSGAFSFEDSNGSISCDASMMLTLFGEAEKESPEGELSSFSGSGCEVSDYYSTICKEGIKSVTQVGAATLTADENNIFVTGLSVLYKFKECVIGSLEIRGDLTFSVTSPKFIEGLGFSETFKVYNSEEEEIDTAETAGTLHVQPPSGIFQLVERAEDPSPPAEEISVDAEEFPAEFSASGGELVFSTDQLEWACDSLSGSGEFKTATAGIATLSLHGCGASGTKCTSTGQESGVIQFTVPLPLYLATVTHAESEEITPAMLFAASGSQFSSFKCSFGLVNVVVGGTGILANIASPDYNESSSTIALHMDSEGGKQEFVNTSEGETEWTLEASVNGGESKPFAISMEFALTMAEEQEITLTEEE